MNAIVIPYQPDHIYQVCTKNNVSIIRTMDYRTQHAELSFDEFLHVTNTSSCFFVFVVGAWHEDEAELTRKRHTHTCCTGWRPRDLGEGGRGVRGQCNGCRETAVDESMKDATAKVHRGKVPDRLWRCLNYRYRNLPQLPGRSFEVGCASFS